MVSGIPSYGALELECEILMFMWSFGPLLAWTTKTMRLVCNSPRPMSKMLSSIVPYGYIVMKTEENSQGDYSCRFPIISVQGLRLRTSKNDGYGSQWYLGPFSERWKGDVSSGNFESQESPKARNTHGPVLKKKMFL